MSRLFLLLGAFTVMACSTGNCRLNEEAEKRKKEEQAGGAVKVPETKMESRVTDHIRVYKYDGSLQCAQGGQPVAEMQKELKGVQVFSAENKPDGLMHMQMCKSPTGKANVYEIDRRDLEAVKKLGFKLWTFD